MEPYHGHYIHHWQHWYLNIYHIAASSYSTNVRNIIYYSCCVNTVPENYNFKQIIIPMSGVVIKNWLFGACLHIRISKLLEFRSCLLVLISCNLQIHIP